MLKIYPVGALTPTSKQNHFIEAALNLGAMFDAWVMLAEEGFAPFPTGSDFFSYMRSDLKVTDLEVRAIGLAWLEAADACLVLPSYLTSEGSFAEIRLATELGIPIFYTIEALRKWRDEQ